MLSIVGESGWGGSKVTYLKSLYLFAAEKGAGEPGCGGVGVARQAHPVCARCKAGKRVPKSPVLSPGPDMAAGVTPFKKKKKWMRQVSFSTSVQLIVRSNDYFIREKVVL